MNIRTVKRLHYEGKHPALIERTLGGYRGEAAKILRAAGIEPMRGGNGGPKGDRSGVGYARVHQRLTRERGRASGYPCADCALVDASEWAFDEPTGFSEDILRYRPLCRSCHWHADRSPACA